MRSATKRTLPVSQAIVLTPVNARQAPFCIMRMPKEKIVMPEANDLPSSFRHVKMLLARTKDHPQGEPNEGYDLLVPLDSEGRLDADIWRKNQTACRVRHFTEDGDARIGRLKRKPGGQWYFDYEPGESDDEIGFRFGEERFLTGEYVSVGHAQNMRTYRVARVEKP